MNRRAFLGLSAAAGLALCSPPTEAQRLQTAEIDIDEIVQDTQLQKCDSWCWAACLSTIFSFYKHPIDQVRIVQDRFGGSVKCQGDPTLSAVVRYLNGTWKDDNGDRFTTKITASYDYYRGINNLTNADIIEALDDDTPLFYASSEHGMVICGADYFEVPGADTQIRRVKVVDPWPSAPRIHNLTARQMVPRDLHGDMVFLATVKVR